MSGILRARPSAALVCVYIPRMFRLYMRAI